MSEKLRPITPAKDWSPDSWQQYPAGQQATYPDNEAVEQVLGQLAKLPPLVTSWEIMAPKKRIAAAQAGKQFVLQGGDCAELVSDCESSIITNRLKVLLQASLVRLQGEAMTVGRMCALAGTYAQPTRAHLETP